MSGWRRQLRWQAMVEMQLIMRPSCPWLLTKDSSGWTACTCQCSWDKPNINWWRLPLHPACLIVPEQKASELMPLFENKDPVAGSRPGPEIRIYKSKPALSKLVFRACLSAVRATVWKHIHWSSVGVHGRRGIEYLFHAGDPHTLNVFLTHVWPPYIWNCCHRLIPQCHH